MTIELIKTKWLLSVENPDGVKLEDIALELAADLEIKNHKLNMRKPVEKYIAEENKAMIHLLKQVAERQTMLIDFIERMKKNG